MSEAMSRRIRGVFNAANFWAIILYNILALNSLEFAKLVGKRLIYEGMDIVFVVSLENHNNRAPSAPPQDPRHSNTHYIT